MKAGISPRDFADAIGVSESSVKRWVDQGTLHAARTAGGHRRIARDEALRFIREQHGQLVRPDKLGIAPSTIRHARSGSTGGAEQLYSYLVTGRDAEVRGVLGGLFLAGQSIAAIADGVIRPAMERLGLAWHEGLGGIFVEHRATCVCLRALEELRSMLREVAPGDVGRRRAVVAGPVKDPYLLAPTLVMLTLVEAGWHAVGLGPETPLPVALLAAREVDARLVVLSFTASPERAVIRELTELSDALEADGRLLAIGGQSAPVLELTRRDHVFIGRTLGELATFVRPL